MDHSKTLDQFPQGSTVTITGLCDCPGARARLCAMGLTPGTTVTIDSNGSGPRRLSVRGASIVLGQGLCSKMMACVTAVHHGSGEDIPADSTHDTKTEGHCTCGGRS